MTHQEPQRLNEYDRWLRAPRISSAVLRVLLTPGSRLVAADLVLQKAVVRRCVQARVPGANRWLRHWTLSAGRSLPRRAFRPPPQVDSAVLVIRRR